VPSCKLTSPSIAAKGHIQDHVHVPSTRDKDFSRTVSWKKRLGLRKHAVCVAEILSFSKMRGMNANPSSPNRRPNVNSENGTPSHNHDLSVRDILRYTQQSSSKNILRDAFRTALPMIISPQELISAQVEE
jgi:hypothetical protein